MEGFGAEIPERYYLPSGELTPEGIEYYNQQIKDYDRPANYEGRAYVRPYSEATVGDTKYRNDTDTTQEFTFTGTLGPTESNLDIYFNRLPGTTDPNPVQVGFVEFSRVVPLFEVFKDTFGSLIQASWIPDSTVITEMNDDWTIEYFARDDAPVLDDYGFVVEDGFTFEVVSDFPDYQGFRLRKPFSEPRSIEVVLNVNSKIIEVISYSSTDVDDLVLDNSRASSVFYHGIWLFGDSWLWVHLTDQGDVANEDVKYPATTPDGETDEYSMIELGANAKTLDLSQFSEIIGPEINEIIIEACAFTLVM